MPRSHKAAHALFCPSHGVRSLQDLVSKIKAELNPRTRSGGMLKYLLANSFWVRRDDAFLKPLGPMDAPRIRSGEYFQEYYRHPVYVWVPDVMFQRKVTCPRCRNTNTIRWGWADNRVARRVCLGKTSGWLVSPRYFCKDCHAAHRAKKLGLRQSGHTATVNDTDGLQYTFFCTPADFAPLTTLVAIQSHRIRRYKSRDARIATGRLCNGVPLLRDVPGGHLPEAHRLDAAYVHQDHRGE